MLDLQAAGKILQSGRCPLALKLLGADLPASACSEAAQIILRQEQSQRVLHSRP